MHDQGNEMPDFMLRLLAECAEKVLSEDTTETVNDWYTDRQLQKEAECQRYRMATQRFLSQAYDYNLWFDVSDSITATWLTIDVLVAAP